MATRPVQEMSDTLAAIRAAKEVQADTLSPELYREANEWFLKARREYKFKDFEEARLDAVRARNLAEQAEFESIRSGGNRDKDALANSDPLGPGTAPAGSSSQSAPSSLPSPSPPQPPSPYEGTPAEPYVEKKDTPSGDSNVNKGIDHDSTPKLSRPN